MKRKRIDIITLGCSKNLVDSEQLMRQLEEAGYSVTHDTENPEGEIAVINTCSFIGDAKEESINMILEFAERKEEGDLKKLFVMGCLSERYLQELAIEIPQVDKFYGKFNWKELLQDLGKTYHEELYIERTLTTPKHYAYLKISEGCDRKCSYCAIPIITGRHISKSMEEILDEVRYLVSQGVKEFQVIAQELTYYGVDLYKKQMLPELIERISEIPGVEWIRLHYAYPAHFPIDLFRVMRERGNVCKYMDIALQHISDNMLKLMRRQVTKEDTYRLIEQFRKEVPGIHLRTTLMVGHPGETEEDFEELKEFVRKVRFDRMGAFAYSEEEGTYAAETYEDSIPQKVKQARLDELMDIQQGISAELSAEKIGKQMVLFTLRTVGRIAHQIRQIGIICSPPKAVDKRIRSMNLSFLRNITMHKISSQAILIQYNRFSACHFHVSETFIIKSCHKFILSLSTQNQHIRLKRIGIINRTMIHIDIRRIHPSVIIQPFAMFQLQHSSFFSGHFDAGDSCHIAGKIEYIRCVVELLPRLYGYRFYCTNRLHLLGHYIL